MKKINVTNRKISSKRLLIAAFAWAAALFIIGNTSCKKESPEAKNKITAALMNAGSNHGRQHVNVRSTGAAADGITDDTKAFQKAIDLVAAHGGGIVWVPPGSYSINADTNILLKSNVTLQMADSARLIAAPSENERYYIIRALNIQDAKIVGGQIIGERDSHLGTGGEHGYGIAVQGCVNMAVENTSISNCWGDGVVISSGNGIHSTNITMKGISSGNNRRQAISVIEVDGLLIDSCRLYHTNGTAPGDGIDIEPDVHSTPRVAKNITITNCDIYSNAGNGIEINARSINIVKNITIQYNKIHGNKYSGYCQRADNVVFTNNWLYANTYEGNRPHNTKCTNSVFTPNTYHEP